MIRATTPTHTFTFTINNTDMEKVLITYAQNGRVVLQKNKSHLTWTTKTEGEVTYYIGSCSLTQQETKVFNSNYPIDVQVRVKTTAGKVLASTITQQTVEDVLNDEVL